LCTGEEVPLHGDKGGLWRYRVGDYRLGGFRTICDIQDERITVLVVKVGHRKDVYR
jgi:mRNA interferase RelE/StbE